MAVINKYTVLVLAFKRLTMYFFYKNEYSISKLKDLMI